MGQLCLVFVSEYFWPEIGGLERSTERLGEHLVLRGHRVRMVTQRLPETSAREQRRGIEILRYSSGNSAPFTAPAVAEGALSDADVVCLFGVGHDPRATWWQPILDASLAPGGVRLLKVGTEGDITLRAIPAELYRRLDGVLCQTTGIAGEAADVGVPAERCFPVRNGLPLRRWASELPDQRDARRQLAIDELAFVVTGLGRFTARKRFGDLVAAFAVMSRTTPCQSGTARPVLVLHGSDFDQSDGVESALRDQVGELDSCSDVRFVPPTIAPGVTLAAADVMATLSEREGAPNVFIEAFASGRPVIATNLTGHRTYVRHGEQGLLTPVGAVTSAAAALAELHANPVRRQAMGRRARVAATDFDITNTSHDYLRAFALARQRS